jgi:triosephosphate isomerase
MSRSYYIAGNWKMHKTRAEAAELAKALAAQLKDGKHKYLVAPSFTSLETVGAIVKGTNIRLGAQNMAAEEQGAHTGEVSVLQLKDLGVQTCALPICPLCKHDAARCAPGSPSGPPGP